MARLMSTMLLAVTCLIVTVYIQQADSCGCNSCNSYNSCNSCNYNYPCFYPYYYPYPQQTSPSTPQQPSQPSCQSCQGSTGASTGTGQGIVFNIMSAPCQQQPQQPDAKANAADTQVTGDTPAT